VFSPHSTWFLHAGRWILAGRDGGSLFTQLPVLDCDSLLSWVVAREDHKKLPRGHEAHGLPGREAEEATAETVSLGRACECFVRQGPGARVSSPLGSGCLVASPARNHAKSTGGTARGESSPRLATEETFLLFASRLGGTVVFL